LADAPTAAPSPEPAAPEDDGPGEDEWPGEGEIVLGEPRLLEAPAEPPAPAAEAPPPPASAPAPSGTGWQGLLGVVWLTRPAGWFALALRRAWRVPPPPRQGPPAPAPPPARGRGHARPMCPSRGPG